METEKDHSHAVHRQNRPRNLAMEQQWQTYFDAARHLTLQNNSTAINLTLSVLMGSNISEFWRYEGSLTTPPCDENVTWTIFKQRILILDYDFEDFRDHLFFESYRGPQPLYNREVYRSFLHEESSPIPDENCCISSKSTTSVSFNIFHRTIILILYVSFQLFYPRLNLT